MVIMMCDVSEGYSLGRMLLKGESKFVTARTSTGKFMSGSSGERIFVVEC